jgi:hypothetical protein
MDARRLGRTHHPDGPNSGETVQLAYVPTDVPSPSGHDWLPDAPTTSPLELIVRDDRWVTEPLTIPALLDRTVREFGGNTMVTPTDHLT